MGGLAIVMVLGGLIMLVISGTFFALRYIAIVIIVGGLGLFAYLHFQAKKERAQIEGEEPKKKKRKPEETGEESS